jgi:hypothetical protein
MAMLSRTAFWKPAQPRLLSSTAHGSLIGHSQGDLLLSSTHPSVVSHTHSWAYTPRLHRHSKEAHNHTMNRYRESTVYRPTYGCNETNNGYNCTDHTHPHAHTCTIPHTICSMVVIQFGYVIFSKN